MDIHEFRALTPDARSEMVFSELQQLRMQLSTIYEEISHFRELEKERKRLRKRRAKAAASMEVGRLQRERGLGQVIKLASNENPHGPSDAVLAVLEKGIRKLNRYPDDIRDRLIPPGGVAEPDRH